eukprot:TRINITY_DN20820_c0_g1_i1.p1 TRINITY_DN20820_c0_g1~~TRINITY_DN20820_c0_g1_i1.p1  ORF type:complete len:372 (-),score=76.94 TRINITY_DN20820_c0_g1_i1:104-1219(-)
MDDESRLTLIPRTLNADEVMFGGIWLGPGGGKNGDGMRPDPGQENANATVAAAVAAGIREFDTAPWYGSGASEERLGRAVKSLSADLASKIRLITKAGRLVREPVTSEPCLSGFDLPGKSHLHDRVFVNDFTAKGTELSLAESLDRLGTSSVYELRIHDPNDNSLNRVGAENFVDEVKIALGKGGMCEALRQLRSGSDGVIQKVGLGMNCNKEAHLGVPEEIIRLLRGAETGTFDSALLAGGWNLLCQVGLPCYSECERLGVEVHVAGVFASGLLVQSGGTYAYREAPVDMVEKAEKWRALASKHKSSLPAVAIAFAALPRCVTRVVIGMASPEQVADVMAWVKESSSVPVAIWSEAKDLGLLDAKIQVPT